MSGMQWQLCALTLLLAAAAAHAQTNTVLPLTLRQAIERALANNLDLKVERIHPAIATWGIVREQAAFDPALTASVNYEDSSEPLNPERAAALGLDSIEQQRLVHRAALTGLLPTGMRYELSAFDTRFSGTLSTNFLYTGAAAISVSQPLLKNFWLGANTALIRVARKQRDIARQNFARQLIHTVRDVHNAYYELVFAIEDHRAALEDLHRAKALLEENRKRAEIGVMSHLDIVQAEAGAAQREEAVIVAAQNIRQRQNALKRLISQDLTELETVELQPLDYPVVEIVQTDLSRSLRTAFERRPDYLAARAELERRNILVQYTRNQLWPQIDLQGSYGLNARAGSFGGFYDNLTDARDPVWTLGVTVTLPLGNLQARANHRIARLEAEQALLNLKRLEQDIIVEVDNAIRQLQTNLKRIEATAAASRLAEQSLNAEQEKLRAGTSTSFLVLQAQAQLAAARSAEIRARADYNQSLAELARAEGTTLEKYNIVLADDD
jgi:outer membrane protein